MNLIIINQYFYPDVSATGQLLTDLAEDLSAKGIKVSVLTSQNSYLGGKKYPLYEVYKGIKIYRARSLSLGKSKTIFRIIDFLFFYLFSFINSLKISNIDVVMCLSVPPLASVLALAISVIKRAKIINKIEDLYPDAAVELGFLNRDSLIYKFLDRISLFSLSKSSCIIVLGEFMKKRLLEKGINIPIHIIDSWADQSEIYPIEKEKTRFYNEWNIAGNFIIHYSGNMGLNHSFDTILEAASRLNNHNDIKFIFVGNGAKRIEIEEYVSKNRLNNVIIKDYVAREYLNDNLNCSDVSVITLRKNSVGIVVPSKLYGIMASGKPIIFVGPQECEIAYIIKQHQIGYIIDDGDADSFVRIVLNLRDNPIIQSKLGNKARLAFLMYYERKIATERHFDILMNLEKSG
jgi:colanic acid biosynthesis glycosyl transferase WcaI